MAVGPDSFVSALHAIAGCFEPQPKSVTAALERLHRPPTPETEGAIAAWIEAKEAAREATCRGLRSEALHAMDVASFTRQAPRLPSKSMALLKGYDVPPPLRPRALPSCGPSTPSRSSHPLLAPYERSLRTPGIEAS